MSPIKSSIQFSPGRVILLSLLATITIGTLLLSLPIARVKPISFIDLLFTATSTACVTGNFTVPIDSFSHFGHTVLMILMQIGGIGLITLTLFLLSLFVNFGFAQQILAGQLLELESWKQIKQIIIFITIFTLSIEALGALACYPFFKNLFPHNEAFFYAVFHSISSFCNAGISLFPNSLELFRTNYPLLLITSLLMIIGALGFITWKEIFYYIRSIKRKKRYAFSLHSRIVIFSTCWAILIATLLYFILEQCVNFTDSNYINRIFTAFFQASSYRSAGYTTIAIKSLSLPTLFVTLFVMFMGSSPGSTGGGVKITAIIIFMATIKAAVTDNTEVEIRGRRLPEDLVYRAIAIVALGISWVCISTLLLLISEDGAELMTVLLESVSSFTNVGISTGLTRHLSDIGKYLIMLSMIIGRIGSLTLILALRQMALRKGPEPKNFSYPEERVMLG
jgi:trk system potassium uptake protein TrkH